MLTKRINFIGIICLIVMVASMLVTACAQPSTPPATKPAAPAAPKVETKVLKFYMNEPAPPPIKSEQSGVQQAIVWFCDEIQKRTNGSLKMDISWGGVLGKSSDAHKIIGGKGVADIGMTLPSQAQWDFPLSATGPSLPFLTEGVQVQSMAFSILANTWSAVQEEYAKWNILPLYFGMSGNYWLTLKWDKPFNSMWDLKGQKIRGIYEHPKIFKKFEIIPVAIGTPETYEALQKGVVIGALQAFNSIKVYKWDEVTNMVVDWRFAGGQSSVPVCINIDIWKSLSPEQQRVIRDVASETTMYQAKAIEVTEKETADYFTKKGYKMVSLPATEVKWIVDNCKKEIWDEWLKIAKERNFPGQQFLDRYQPLVAQVKRELKIK